MIKQEATKPSTKEEALAVLKTCEGYENVDLHEDESGFLSGTHPNGLPARIAGSDDTGWFEIHGGICEQWLGRGGATGELGLPLSNEERDPDYRDPNGKCSRFQHGTIHGWPTDTSNVRGEWTFEVEHLTDSSKTPWPAKEMSEQTKNRLKKFDEELAELRRLQSQLDGAEFIAEAKRAFDNAMSEIVRRRRAFDSKTFFMVTFGMLKAGKSTLVNTFVGKQVSPVGSTHETTLRSSIILAADSENREGIYIYEPKNSADIEVISPDALLSEEEANKRKSIIREKEVNDCRLMMDFLNGSMVKSEFLELFYESIEDYSDDNLRKYIATKGEASHPNAFLPPIIRISFDQTDHEAGSANLLKDGVAILDTPGLDGVVSNKDLDPFWEILPSSGDYFLFVQSSMSAINKDCQDLILKIYRATKNPPVLVVFNEIASDFWLKSDEERKVLRERANAAAEELSKKLREALGGIVPTRFSVNAGEASAAVFDAKADESEPEDRKVFQTDRESMLKDSRIRDLRKEIINTLQSKRSTIKEQNATSRMVKALDNFIPIIQNARKNLLDTEAEAAQNEEKKRKDAAKTNDELNNAFMKDGDGFFLGKAVGQTMEEELNNTIPPYPTNPYSLTKGFGRNEKHNHDYKKGTAEEKVFMRIAATIKKAFSDHVARLLVGRRIPTGQKPWIACIQNSQKHLDYLQNAKDRLFESGFLLETATDRLFPELLFKDFDVNTLLNFLDTKEFSPDPTIPRLKKYWKRNKFTDYFFSNWPFGEDTVWECECAKQFKTFMNDLKPLFPNAAAKKTGDSLCEAIVKKGQDYAAYVSKRLDEALEKDLIAFEARRERVNANAMRLAEAVSLMEKMKRILTEG